MGKLYAIRHDIKVIVSTKLQNVLRLVFYLE